MRRTAFTLVAVGFVLTSLACASGASMSVADFLRTHPYGTSEMISVRGPVVASLNDRTFAMGDGENVILVVAPGDDVPVGTRADAGEVVVVTGTAQMMRRGDPAMPFIDERIKDELLRRPGIIASNVQVVDTVR